MPLKKETETFVIQIFYPEIANDQGLLSLN